MEGDLESRAVGAEDTVHILRIQAIPSVGLGTECFCTEHVKCAPEVYSSIEFNLKGIHLVYSKMTL